MTDVTVVIPVGPKSCYLKWLPECFESVLKQTYKPINIILVDDGANLFETPSDAGISHSYPFSPGTCLMQDAVTMPETLYNAGGLSWWNSWWHNEHHIMYTIWKSPCNLGVDAAFNIGIALSQTNLVFTLGSDDIMYPTCLEECVKEYEKRKVEGWYNVTVELQSGEIMALANNTAMITKKLWKWTGGFPPSAGIGGCDALLLSILLKHEPHKIIQVKQGTPLCWLREHKDQDTKRHAAKFNKEVISVRNIETAEWVPRGTS